MIPPLHAHGPTLPLYHFGALMQDPDGKTRVDPERFGARKWTESERRATPDPKRAFFYLSPAQREWMFDHSRLYRGEVPTAHVYDAHHDPDGLMRDGGLPRVVREGYKGVYYPIGHDTPVVAMFHPVEVQEVQKPQPAARAPSKLLFARTNAPKGGMVANNLFVPGGRFVARPLARVRSVMERFRARVQLSRPSRQDVGNPELQAIAAKYRADHGLTHTLSHLDTWSRPHAKHMSDVYEGLVSDPSHPDVHAAYRALAAETRKQFDYLAAHGIHPEYMEDDPYPNSAAMMHDLATRKRIKVFKTGPGQSHPALSDEENDMFRFVHDVFGHAMHGHQFGPKGEDNAFRDHASMFSPLARRAMATETRGQNSYMNAGPHSHLPVTERPFAQQKAALWPEHLMGEYHEMPMKLARLPQGAARAKDLKPWAKSLAEMPEDRVRRGSFADFLEERGHHHSEDDLKRLRDHDGPLFVVRHPKSGKVVAVPGAPVTLDEINRKRASGRAMALDPELVEVFHGHGGVHLTYRVPGTDNTPNYAHTTGALQENGTVRWDTGNWTSAAAARARAIAAAFPETPVHLARKPLPPHESLQGFEGYDLGRMQPAARAEHDKMLTRALDDKPGRLPTIREVKALATFGEPVKGGYEDANRIMTKLMGSPGEAQRWAAANAILSANTPWLDHTHGATHAMALWHLAGHPTDEATLRDLFGHTEKGATGPVRYVPGKGSVFGTGAPHPSIPKDAYVSPVAPPMYFADKSAKLVRLFSQPHGKFTFDPKGVSDGSYKTPNFALAHFHPDGVPIDTHMAKAVRLLAGDQKKRQRETIMDAKKRMIGRAPVSLAYKALVAEAGKQLGWEPRAVQEAVWVGVLSIMAAKRMGATDYSGLVSRLNKQAMRSGWDMHSVFKHKTMSQALHYLGADDKLQAVVDASRRDHPIPAAVPPTTSDRAALTSVAEELPSYIPAAAEPIVDALRHGPVKLSRAGGRYSTAFDALIRLAILATVK